MSNQLNQRIELLNISAKSTFTYQQMRISTSIINQPTNKQTNTPDHNTSWRR